MQKFTVLFLSLTLILGCSKKKENSIASADVISINPASAEEYINLSELVDSVQCIKLQIDSGDVMGEIQRIIIRDKYIYAKDKSLKQIFVFDKEGKFISKLDKRGQGPGEYINFSAFFVDEKEEYLELLNFRGKTIKIFKYDNIDFNFIESSSLPGVSYNSCRKQNGIYYFSNCQMDNSINGNKTNANLFILGKDSVLHSFFDKNIETNNNYFLPYGENFTLNEKDELFVSLMYDNTFYQLDNGNVYPFLKIDFGKYNMDVSVGNKSTTEQMKYIKEMSGKASFPVLNVNNDKILSFSYYFKEKKGQEMFSEKDLRQYIKFKGTDKIYNTKKIRNDLTDFPDNIVLNSGWVCSYDVCYKDYLVYVVKPDQYFKDSETKEIYVDGLGKITEFDDPIVVFMKLK
ncbi:MAG: 6-bladed beta-propeller [Dysgonamonadaceae bacterium]|nr:6-bladed beta-propeller [Dysgonamonadaceae bacterium]